MMTYEYSKKHAYLIMAHSNYTQLATLVSLLDDERNDIYIHMDKKSKNFSPELIKVKYSDLFFIDRITVNWGGSSMIDCEMNLLRAAHPKHYQYYHLLSGVDLPIKTQDEIHRFFDEHCGSEFIAFDPLANENQEFLFRVHYYHFFREIIGKNQGKFYTLLKLTDRLSLNIQKKLKVKRKEYFPQYKGSNWVSITDNLVEYVLNNEEIIKKQYKMTSCCDELFIHSIAMKSPQKDNIVRNNYRFIDWKRGKPYTFRREDVNDILSSDAFFSRKFDCTVDNEAINEIVKHLEKAK